MLLLADLIAAFATGLLALVAARRYARSTAMPERPTEEVARVAAEAVREHTRLEQFVGRRLDPSVATGMLLTLALAVTLVGGLVLGILAVLVHRVVAVQDVDNSVAAWAYVHRGPASTSGLKAITDLGSIRIVLVVAVVLALFEAIRHRNGWSFLFLLVVLAGMEATMLGVKELVGRLRPALDPAATQLGPSFPSGHSATAAAFYAAAALIIGRSLKRPARQFVIAAAVAIAVAVATSRILLDLHWLSDVVGGLSLGWAWFALCAVIFGGQLLRPTAAADLASAEAGAPKPQRAEHSRQPPVRALASGVRKHRCSPPGSTTSVLRQFDEPRCGEVKWDNNHERCHMPDKMNDPRDLFLHELGDVLYAERTLVKTLPKLKNEASDEELARGFEEHLTETKQHVLNVEQAFEALGEKPKAEKCPGIEGIQQEHDEFVSNESPSPEVLNSFLTGAGARTEHYEIAAYEGLVTSAEAMGENEVVELLSENLEQELKALAKMKAIGKRLAQDGAKHGAAA